MIKKLEWDSNFFGFNVGQIIEINNISASAYHLLILYQKMDNQLYIDGFENSFQETKLIFSKNLNAHINNSLNILDTDFSVLQPTDLYNLAYESGKYSRFKLDNKFTANKFRELYRKWIDNSLKKQFADKVFYIKKGNFIQGFVSIKKQNTHATIGLIAVDSSQQGQGIGQQLLQKAENYSIENNIFKLYIPTQKENQQACSFYIKNGYTILEETIIKHYWKQ